MSLVLLVLIFIWLGILGVSLTTYLLTYSSIIIASLVIFGNSARNVFEGVIFQFVLHPFDQGDKVTIDGEWYTVHRMNLNSTVLRRGDGWECVVMNAVLANKTIYNHRRSPAESESVTFNAHVATTQE